MRENCYESQETFSALISFAILLGFVCSLPMQAMASENSISISLNHSVMDVDVGRGFLLTATVISESTGTVTWSTNKSAIATVNSSGYVTGKQAGTAVITATYTDINGASYSCSYYINAENTVSVLSYSLPGLMSTSQTMGENMADAIGAENSYVIAVDSNNFADIWNSTTSDYIIIHTHGLPNGLYEDVASIFTTADISQLERNEAIGFVLITACEIGGLNGSNPNIAASLSQYIAQDGIVVCCTTVVEGADTHFTATNSGQWIAYCNGQQIPCNLPATITMESVADFWEGFK